MPDEPSETPEPNGQPPVEVHHHGPEVVVAAGPSWWDQLPGVYRSFLQLGFAGLMAAVFVVLVWSVLGQVKDAGAERDRQNATIIRLIDLNHETQDRNAREVQAVRDNTNRRHEQLLVEMAEWRREVRDIAGSTRDTQKAVLMLVEGLNRDHDGIKTKIDEIHKLLVKGEEGVAEPRGADPWAKWDHPRGDARPEPAPAPRRAGG